MTPPGERPEFEPAGFDSGDLATLMRYESAGFQERLGRLVESDEDFRRRLDAATAVMEGNRLPPPTGEVTLPELPAYNQGQVDLLARFVGNSQVDSVVVEAGHVYTYHDVHRPNLAAALESQFAQAAVITDRLRRHGVAVREILFIDNYNPNPETGELDELLDMSAYLALAHGAGYAPEFVAYEADMADLAQRLLEDLAAAGRVTERSPDPSRADLAERGRQVLLRYRSHELFRPDDGPDGMYSCALLDSALSLLKMTRLAEGSINVLPQRTDDLEFSYNSQQRKTRQIVGEHLGTRVLPMLNFYTGDSLLDLSAAGAHHTLRKKGRPRVVGG